MANISLMKVKSIAECCKGSILQDLWPALSDDRSWKTILVFFFSGCWRQVLLYIPPPSKRGSGGCILILPHSYCHHRDQWPHRWVEDRVHNVEFSMRDHIPLLIHDNSQPPDKTENIITSWVSESYTISTIPNSWIQTQNFSRIMRETWLFYANNVGAYPCVYVRSLISTFLYSSAGLIIGPFPIQKWAKTSQMVYIIHNLAVLHFVENFMRAWTKLELFSTKKQMSPPFWCQKHESLSNNFKQKH